MTPSVTDQAPISDKIWRRHTDPPGLWIAVAASSVALHLLLLGLMRSYGLGFLSQKSSSNAVPVEFITISPRKTATNVKPKLSSPKKSPTAQNPISAKVPKQVPQRALTAHSSPVEDRNAIAFTNTPPIPTTQKVEPKSPPPEFKVSVDPEPPQSEPSFAPIPPENPEPEPTPTIDPFENQQPEPTPSPVFTENPEPEPTPTIDPFENQQPEPTPSPVFTENPEPEPTPTIDPFENQQPEPTPSPVFTENSENQDNSDRFINPQNNIANSTNTDTSTEDSKTNNLPENLPKPEGEIAVGKETPLEDLTQPVKPEQQGGGIGLASWEIETEAVQKDIPENLAKPIGNNVAKELNFSPDEKLGSEPINFQASLLIDSNGNIRDVYLPPSIPRTQRNRYREYVLELFKNQKFIPATTGGKKSDISNLVVRITIKPKSP